MEERTQSGRKSFPVVGRCNDVHDDYQGSYLRGVVYMRDGEFFAGLEELWEPDSLNALNITFSEGPGFKTSSEALEAAAEQARDASQASRLGHEADTGESDDPEICTITETHWLTADELEEVKGHIGFLSTEEEGDQYYAGIERSHRGGDSEVVWYGPSPSAAVAEVLMRELICEETMSPSGFREQILWDYPNPWNICE